MVVVLDPSADPDDILRANRSREKHYIFDHAFDQMAKQVHVSCLLINIMFQIFFIACTSRMMCMKTLPRI